ncbi:MAG: glycosyltransferase family 2 protein [Armatimonadota bacterium]
MASQSLQPVKPVLSVCIPTYNRAKLLRSALFSVMPQVAELNGKVELIVCDNCSDDMTQEVVQAAPYSELIRYTRNSENIGAARNFALCVEKATGEYVWLVGDDDIIREDGLARLMSVLENHPEVDYVYVNTTILPASEYEAFDRVVCGNDFSRLLPTFGGDLSERLLDKWDELIDPAVDSTFQTAIMCSVFRRHLWLNVADQIDFGQPFCTSLASVYSHAQILAKSMVGRKAYYLGYPCLIAFGGSYQSWRGYIPVLLTVWFHELFDAYEQYGVEKWRVEKCRRELLRNSAGAVARLVLCKGLPGKEHFSIWRYLRRFSRYPDLWLSFTILPVWRRLNAAYQIVKRLMNSRKRRT